MDLRSGTASEVVCSIGGGLYKTGCDQVTPIVLKMANPDIFAPWVPSLPLNKARNSSNAVLGLDGAIYVFSGVDGACEPVMEPERLRPSEVFQPGTDGNWELMCPQEHQRSYHSWAALMEHGSIASGGGPRACATLPCPAADCNHSIEVFKPPHMFRGPQPQIVNWPSTPPTRKGGETLDIEVVLPGNDVTGEFRVGFRSRSMLRLAITCSPS